MNEKDWSVIVVMNDNKMPRVMVFKDRQDAVTVFLDTGLRNSMLISGLEIYEPGQLPADLPVRPKQRTLFDEVQS